MTTNQTIDGVPRELLADLASYGESGKVPEPWMVERLRGLLDAPACEFHQSADECETYSGKHPRSTAAQPQGEPVAWQYRVSAGPQTGWSLWHDGKGEEFKQSYQVETRPLYAEQPAPDRPPHANPPTGTEPSGTHHDNDGLAPLVKP